MQSPWPIPRVPRLRPRESARDPQVIEQEDVAGILETHIQKMVNDRRKRVEVKEIRGYEKLVFPPGDLSYDVVLPDQADRGGTVSASIRFLINGKEAKKIRVTAQVNIFTDVVVARSFLKKEPVIQEKDLQLVNKNMFASCTRRGDRFRRGGGQADHPHHEQPGGLSKGHGGEGPPGQEGGSDHPDRGKQPLQDYERGRGSGRGRQGRTDSVVKCRRARGKSMEEFWTQIPPRSIIDEFISGEGAVPALTDKEPVSHSENATPQVRRFRDKISSRDRITFIKRARNGPGSSPGDGTTHSARRLEKES